MSQDDHDTATSKLPWDVIIHSSAGVLCLVIGGLMVFEVYLWATDVFSGLMLVTFLSAIVISTTTQSWCEVTIWQWRPSLASWLDIWGMSGVLCWPMVYCGWPSSISFHEALSPLRSTNNITVSLLMDTHLVPPRQPNIELRSTLRLLAIDLYETRLSFAKRFLLV